MSALQKMFDRLREQSIPYVVMSSLDGFPQTALNPPVEMLIDNGTYFDRALAIMALHKVGEIAYESQLVPGVPFYIIKKGDGYFPERFESKILARRYTDNCGIYVPDSEDMLWATLYDITVHRRKPTRHHSIVMMQAVQNRVGVAPCSYQSVTTRVTNA